MADCQVNHDTDIECKSHDEHSDEGPAEKVCADRRWSQATENVHNDEDEVESDLVHGMLMIYV